MILNALEGKPLPIYGDGGNVRDWLYVDDHCAGVQLALERGRPGHRYNLGGFGERTNLEIVDALCTELERLHPAARNPALARAGVASYAQLKRFVTDRPGHDRRYAIDSTRAQHELGWKPPTISRPASPRPCSGISSTATGANRCNRVATSGNGSACATAQARSPRGGDHAQARIAIAAALALAVAAQAALRQGDGAPPFTAQVALAGKASTFSLADALQKGPVVVYFYPSAFTGGCNLEAHAFATQMEAFTAAGVAVIGVFARQPRTPDRLLGRPEVLRGQVPGRLRSRRRDCALVRARRDAREVRRQGHARHADRPRVHRAHHVRDRAGRQDHGGVLVGRRQDRAVRSRHEVARGGTEARPAEGEAALEQRRLARRLGHRVEQLGVVVLDAVHARAHRPPRERERIRSQELGERIGITPGASQSA
jgi:hypothetical protein